VEERDGGGAADNGVDPEPPPHAKYGARDARSDDRPRRQEVVVVHRRGAVVFSESDSDAEKGKGADG
jgi:hypothetical protein